MPPFDSLPAEILSRILELTDFPQGDWWRRPDLATLRAAALVSRYWKIPAQRRLFQRVVLDSSEMARLWIASEAAGRFTVKSLSLFRLDERLERKALERCGRLEVLRLRPCDCDGLDWGVFALAGIAGELPRCHSFFVVLTPARSQDCAPSTSLAISMSLPIHPNSTSACLLSPLISGWVTRPPFSSPSLQAQLKLSRGSPSTPGRLLRAGTLSFHFSPSSPPICDISPSPILSTPPSSHS
jgi:hypothetical protein